MPTAALSTELGIGRAAVRYVIRQTAKGAAGLTATRSLKSPGHEIQEEEAARPRPPQTRYTYYPGGPEGGALVADVPPMWWRDP